MKKRFFLSVLMLILAINIFIINFSFSSSFVSGATTATQASSSSCDVIGTLTIDENGNMKFAATPGCGASSSTSTPTTTSTTSTTTATATSTTTPTNPDSPLPDKCIDSDVSSQSSDGKDSRVAGIVTLNGKQYKDSCYKTTLETILFRPSTKVKEYYCKDNKPAIIYLDCDKSSKCVDGACVVGGTTTTENTNPTSEMYCSFTSTSYDGCPEGYRCTLSRSKAIRSCVTIADNPCPSGSNLEGNRITGIGHFCSIRTSVNVPGCKRDSDCSKYGIGSICYTIKPAVGEAVLGTNVCVPIESILR